MIPALVLLLVAGQGGGLVSQRSGEPVDVSGDRGTRNTRTGVTTLDGHATLRTSTSAVKADHIAYEEATKRVVARGNVLAVSGLTGIVAEELTLDLDDARLTMQRGRFFEKKKVAPEQLLAASTPAQLQAAGQTSVAGSAKTVNRLEPGHFWVEDLTFTPCDCNPLEPHWDLRAWRADVKANERAILWFPVVHVYGAPVLVLPVLYVPLSDRETGLLVTKPSHSQQNGWSVEQPLFVTLGQSADVELTPGYYFGPSTDPSRPLPSFGVKGPILTATTRYVPSRDTRGTLELTVLDSRLPPRDPVTLGRDATGSEGLRGLVTGSHTQELGEGWFDRVDVNLASDANLTKDLTTDLVAQANQYLRSSAVVYRRTADSWLGLDVTARQDTQFGFSLFETNVYRPTADVPPVATRGPNTIQRLPGIHLDLPERALLGAVTGSLSADLARFAPFTGRTGDEGTDGIWLPTDSPEAPAFGTTREGTQGNFRVDPNEREARVRLDVVPRLATTIPLGSVLRIRPSIWLREDLYAGAASGAVDQRGYLAGNVRIESELSRTFGSGAGEIRHTIVPSLEYREIPAVWGEVPGYALNRRYDELDAAVSAGALRQAVVKLSQTLRRPVGKVSQEVLRLDLSQEFDLRDSHRLADSVAALRFQAGALTGTGQFRYDTQARRPGLVSLEAALQRPRFGVSARFDQLFVPAQSYLPAGGVPPSIGPDPGTGLLGVGEDAFAHPGGSGLQRQTLDALVGSRLAPEVRKGTREQQIVVSGRALLGYGLGLTYTAYFYPTLNGTTAFVDSTNVSHPSQAQFFGQQYLGLTFAPACDCWRLDLLAHFNRPLDGGSPFKAPDFFFNLTISHFGSFGGG